jgi:hypothetical protein
LNAWGHLGTRQFSGKQMQQICQNMRHSGQKPMDRDWLIGASHSRAGWRRIGDSRRFRNKLLA